MGEAKMDILESNVKHNTEDIRELKSRMERAESDVNDLKTNHQVTSQTLGHVMSTLEELKSDFKATNKNMDKNFKSINDKVDENQIEQLKEYKSGVWKIGVMVVGGVVTALVLFFIGLQ